MSEISGEQSRYLSGKAVKKMLNVSDNTLRRWANENKIDYIRNTAKGKRYYDITSILNLNNDVTKLKSTFIRSGSQMSLADPIEIDEADNSDKIDDKMNDLSINKKIYAYCRPVLNASISKQESAILEKYPDVMFIKSTCSNKDWQFNKILDVIINDAHNNKIDQLILYNSEIISKTYYPVIEHVLKLYKIKITILS
jgi:DNA-binding transcriptional MerR regulator